jgi:hypothetical protein
VGWNASSSGVAAPSPAERVGIRVLDPEVALEADAVDRHVPGLELPDERERGVALGADRLEVVVVVSP